MKKFLIIYALFLICLFLGVVLLLAGCSAQKPLQQTIIEDKKMSIELPHSIDTLEYHFKYDSLKFLEMVQPVNKNFTIDDFLNSIPDNTFIEVEKPETDSSPKIKTKIDLKKKTATIEVEAKKIEKPFKDTTQQVINNVVVDDNSLQGKIGKWVIYISLLIAIGSAIFFALKKLP